MRSTPRDYQIRDKHQEGGSLEREIHSASYYVLDITQFNRASRNWFAGWLYNFQDSNVSWVFSETRPDELQRNEWHWQQQQVGLSLPPRQKARAATWIHHQVTTVASPRSSFVMSHSRRPFEIIPTTNTQVIISTRRFQWERAKRLHSIRMSNMTSSWGKHLFAVRGICNVAQRSQQEIANSSMHGWSTSSMTATYLHSKHQAPPFYKLCVLCIAQRDNSIISCVRYYWSRRYVTGELSCNKSYAILREGDIRALFEQF